MFEKRRAQLHWMIFAVTTEADLCPFWLLFFLQQKHHQDYLRLLHMLLRHSNAELPSSPNAGGCIVVN